jgi:hypothetical protein
LSYQTKNIENMITLTLNLATPQLGTPIKNNFLEQIKYHTEQKRLARNQRAQLDQGVIKLRDEILTQLNSDLGEEVWKLDSHSFNEIGFIDIRQNTCYNTWDIRIYYDVKVVKYGELSYEVANVEKGIYITLIPSRANDDALSKDLREKKGYKKVGYDITDLAKVHELCNANYLTYFTNKATQIK